MPFGLGFFATAGGGAAGGASFDLLETQVLSGSQASVTFSSLNTAYGSTYQHLQIRATARTDRSGADSDPVILQFNGDGGSNYSRHALGGYNFGASSAVYSNQATSQTSLFLAENMPVSSSTTDSFGGFITDILDPFETTKNTTVRTLNAMSAAWSSVELRSGAWFNTNAITSFVIKPLIGGNFVANSRFSLYGLKAA